MDHTPEVIEYWRVNLLPVIHMFVENRQKEKHVGSEELTFSQILFTVLWYKNLFYTRRDLAFGTYPLEDLQLLYGLLHGPRDDPYGRLVTLIQKLRQRLAYVYELWEDEKGSPYHDCVEGRTDWIYLFDFLARVKKIPEHTRVSIT